MVRGLELFRDKFSDYCKQYVLIGGAACDILMERSGLEFRVTKDLDIVLFVESLSPEFARTFWAFIEDGGFSHRHKATGGNQYYRFEEPADSAYPQMIELFSTKPDLIDLAANSQLTPLPIGDKGESLSAILLNAEYYNLIHSGVILESGLPVVSAECLIPLKARAWLDLSERKTAGEEVDSRHVKKHKNDVFRLFRIIDPATALHLGGQLRVDMERFLAAMRTEAVDLKNLGITDRDLAAVLVKLDEIYLSHR